MSFPTKNQGSLEKQLNSDLGQAMLTMSLRCYSDKKARQLSKIKDLCQKDMR